MYSMPAGVGGSRRGAQSCVATADSVGPMLVESRDGAGNASVLSQPRDASVGSTSLGAMEWLALSSSINLQQAHHDECMALRCSFKWNAPGRRKLVFEKYRMFLPTAHGLLDRIVPCVLGGSVCGVKDVISNDRSHIM
jgi:hypothetical protein